MDQEDAHFMVKNGLLKLWQQDSSTKPHLIGADEVYYEGVQPAPAKEKIIDVPGNIYSSTVLGIGDDDKLLV